MTKKVGVGRAHSKIILIGEHAVVYGYPALALPLTNIEVTCRILPSDHAWILYDEDTLSMAVFASLEFLGVQEAYIRCEIESMVPEKRGMGSSAAVSIAAIRAVFDYYEQELDRETLEILANRAEMIAHMNPSGLDAKTCLSNHAIKFIKNVGFSEFETNSWSLSFDCRHRDLWTYTRSDSKGGKYWKKGFATFASAWKINQ